MKFLQEQIVADHKFGVLQPGFRIPPLNADTVMYYLQLAHSMRREERLEAQAYFRIAEECKLDEQTQGKQFYLLLTEMIKKYQIRIKEGTCSQEDRKWQQQLVLVLKNSLRRNMDKLCYDNETKFRVIDGLTKHILKAELLSIIKDPSIEDSLYNEVLEVVKLFIDENFPNSWPELTKNYLDSCISHLFEACLSISNYPKIDKAVFTRFLNLYLVIMKELKPRRGKKIYDITNHLVEISSMVDFTDFTKSEFDPEIGWKLKNCINPSSEEDMNIIQKVDKLTLLMIEKSFSSRSIKSEDDIALYFKLMDSFCKKLSFCVKSIKTIKSHYIQNPLALGMEIEAIVLDASLNNLSKHCKMVLGHFMKILDLQPLLFTHIYKYYLEICFDIFFNCNLFEQCVLQKTVRCLENVIDTEENCPTEKLVNFPDQRKLFEDQHNEIFTPANVKRVLSFLAINFMAKCSIEDHENKPESPQCTILPDLLICEKLCFNFLPIVEEWVIDCLQVVLNETMPLTMILKEEIDSQELFDERCDYGDHYCEDAIFVFIGLLPDVYHNKLMKPQDRINIVDILNYLEQKIRDDESMLYKLRYCSLIDHWVYSFEIPQLCKYLDRILILLTNCEDMSIEFVVTCVSIITRFLSQIMNYKLALQGIDDKTPAEVSHLEVIKATVNYETIFTFLIKSALFSQQYASNLSPLEFISLTSLVKIVLDHVDLEESTEHAISLLECLDLISNKHKIDCSTESEILCIWQKVLRKLAHNPHIVYLALLKLESVMQKENYESFWLLNTHHQYQYECESSKFVLLFIQSAQNCDFQLKTEIRIIELLSCIYMRLTTHPTLKSLELFEVKVEILRFLAVKLILVLEGNGELSCILPFSKEFGRQPKGIKGEYTHIFTQALVASYKELISKCHCDDSDSTCEYIFAVFKFFNIGLSGSLIFRKYLFSQKALPEVYEILNAWYSRYTQCQKEESLALCQIGLATMASMIMKFFLPSSSDRELKEKTMSLISNLRESLKIRAVDLQMLATEKVKEEKFTSMVSSCLNDYLLK